MPAALDPPADALLASATLKGLGDKLYDRRKAAALEVEQLIKHLAREVRRATPAGPAGGRVVEAEALA